MSDSRREFLSRRSEVLATHGMVATSHPLAAQAGLRTLQAGGNAIDAAVVTAMVLTVVEPMSTGAGGDAFALIRLARDGHVRAMNGSGRAPAAADIEALRARGWEKIPRSGPFAVTVPGSVDAWYQALAEFGSISWADALKPAIDYAENGFPVSPIIGQQWQWQANVEKLQANAEAARVYLPGGRPPRIGERFRQPDLARTYRTLAEEGPEAFYQGPIAAAMADAVQAEGGWLAPGDLYAHRTTWERPISTNYKGVTVFEHPPNGQGLVALLALNLISEIGLNGADWGTLEATHVMAEAMKLAFADGHRYIADPATANIPVDALLSSRYTAERSRLISRERAMENPCPGIPPSNDTVYLTVVDEEGNAVSFINSLFTHFGSGIVAPGTGVCLQNRGSLFDLDPKSPNALEPGKRPYHTIIPAMATRGDKLWMSFGVMGGFMQPQGHTQVLINLLDYGMSYQEALDAPRWRVDEDGVTLSLETGMPEGLGEGLRRLGHKVDPIQPRFSGAFGGGQIVAVDEEQGALWGASDPRKDGCALGW